MSDLETRFHETWLGMVQPIDGLVLSVPVLADAQCMERQPPATQRRFTELCPPYQGGDGARAITDLSAFLAELLGLTPDLFDGPESMPEDLSLWVPEGKQTLRPTLALRKKSGVSEPSEAEDTAKLDRESTPASRAGAPYVMLLWDVPNVRNLDKPETTTGPWEYPALAKFDRLLRHCRVPIGLLTNRRELRLVYAPHGASSGSITFKVDDIATVGGRPILDAFVMLLSRARFFSVAKEHQLPSLLAESRTRQANVTNTLADQVFEALEVLLAGFDAAAERDGRELLQEALERGDDYLYGGLLTVLLRLVFLLYAEDRGLLPVEHPVFEEHYSLGALFEELQADHAAHPDSMSRRFGAWGRLIALFRAVYLGVEHGDEGEERLRMPPRRGELFDPHTYPFLEGWGPGGSAPITQAEDRANVRVPSVDDETIFRVLERLIRLDGLRLSYRALDVEQIGSVYEALMGYHVVRLPAPAISMRPHRIWVTAEDIRAVAPARRDKYLKDEVGLSTAQAAKIAEALKAAKTDDDLLTALEMGKVAKSDRAKAGRLVLQPGSERRRTSSHYTPRSLSAPIVRRTLEPLIAAMGESPSSERLLDLVICDPAMGSGAFLVEACRYLADQVVAAWTREKKLDLVASATEDVVNHARRLVAQRCLYGVDKNRFAVNLAKLSLWLVTLAREAPFTFVDHALRHGDSLVGLDFDQIRAGHWKPGDQLELFTKELDAALGEAVALRQKILELAHDGSPRTTNEKERLLWDAEDALDRVRLVGDVVVGAFFAKSTDKEREKERLRRLELVREWLQGQGGRREELEEMRREIRARIPVFHWFIEFPEVFWSGRPDPLEKDKVNEAAYVDAIIGNPPFAGKNVIVETNGEGYTDWLMACWPEVKGRPNTDLCAYFFRKGAWLLGRHGTLGLIATNTIAQGDSRLVALECLCERGAVIFAANPGFEWPGDAAVRAATVHLAFGDPARSISTRMLDGQCVANIDSRLRAEVRRPDPSGLSANVNIAFMGGKLVGAGLAMPSDEAEVIIKRDIRSAEVLRPYLGGEENNSHPASAHRRFMIDFATKSLEEAEAWPALLAIVKEKVKPARDRDKRGTYRKYWWRPGESGGALYSALTGLRSCLVLSRHTKHIGLSRQPTTPFFSEGLYVFALESFTAFGVLQSRAHETWARLLSSSMKSDLRYAASDCFETFPFPHSDPRAIIPSLEDIGERLYSTRAALMLARQQGLTTTYNQLKDPENQDPEIIQLRSLHEELDRAVLAAYGWADIAVPPYTTPTTPEDSAALEAFQDEVIDRLFVLNAERAEAERLQAAAAAPTKPSKRKATPKAAKKKPPTTSPIDGAPAASAAQSPLFGVEGAGTSKGTSDDDAP